jgi:hypothetical protein
MNEKGQPLYRNERSHVRTNVIHLWHIEEKFGGIVALKREWVRTQHRVTTDHLANMGGPTVHRRQPRLRYVEAEDKFIVENEYVNPFMELG